MLSDMLLQNLLFTQDLVTVSSDVINVTLFKLLASPTPCECVLFVLDLCELWEGLR